MESRSQELPCQGFLRAEVLSQKCQERLKHPAFGTQPIKSVEKYQTLDCQEVSTERKGLNAKC